MLYDINSLLRSTNIKEKIYKGIKIIYFNSKPRQYKYYFNIDSININFLFKNMYWHRLLFYACLILLEKLTLSRFKFLKIKKSVTNFNTREGLITGASYWLRNYKKDRFIHIFTNYFFKKLNYNFILTPKEHHINNIIKYKNYYEIPEMELYFNRNAINIGFRKFLFNSIFSSNDIDYEFFLPIYQQYMSGMNINLYFNYRSLLVNRLILSHHNININ